MRTIRLVQQALSLFGLTLIRRPKALLDCPRGQLELTFSHILSKYLIERDGDPYFVQIGAYNGMDGDPLYAFVSRGLLKGCLVEPQADMFEQLKANYRDVDGLTFRRAAIGSASRAQRLYRVKPGTQGPPWLGQVASLRRDVLLKLQDVVPEIESAIMTEEVPTVTPDVLFSECGRHPDVVVIDTEGYDFEIIKLLDLDRHAPHILHYEHKHLSPTDADACLRLLIDKGYRLVMNNQDTTACLTTSNAVPALEESWEQEALLARIA